MQNNFKQVESKLNQFIDRLYLFEAIRGLLYFIAFSGILFFTVALTTLFFEFNGNARLLTLTSFLVSSLGLFIYWVILPILRNFRVVSRMSVLKAAKLIYSIDSHTGEKLVNTIELNEESINNELIIAAINQITLELKLFDFKKYVDRKRIVKGLKAIVPFITVFLLIIISGNYKNLQEGSVRLLAFNKEYKPLDYVAFNITSELEIEQGLDYVLTYNLISEVVTKNTRVFINNREIPVIEDIDGSYKSIIRNVQEDIGIRIESGKYASEFDLKVIKLPFLVNYELLVTPPPHTGMDLFNLSGSNVIDIPENSLGDIVFFVRNTKKVEVLLDSTKSDLLVRDQESIMNIDFDGSFSTLSINADEKILGSLKVNWIKDQYPKLEVDIISDTLNVNGFIAIGKISDDYGFSSLSLKQDKASTKTIPLRSKSKYQEFYFPFTLENSGDVYIEVRDNDKPNRYKSTRSKKINLKYLTKEEVEEQLQFEQNKKTSELEKVLKKMQKNSERLNDEWKEEQRLKELEKSLNESKELNKDLLESLKREQEKARSNEEINRLQEELAKRMEETDQDILDLLEDIQRMQEELNKNEFDYQKTEMQLETVKMELERSLEFLKQLQYEKKLDDLINKLETLEKKQEDLSKIAEQEESEEQESIDKDIEQLQEELKELGELEKEIENKNDNNQEESEKALEEAKKESEKALEELNKKNKRKSNESQKKASEELKKAKKGLQDKKSSLQMQSSAENMEDLRQLLKNVVQLSIEEEELLKSIRQIEVDDPSYQSLMKQQAKLRDDSKVIRDSLNALMKRIPEIENYVTKEVVMMMEYFELSNDNLKNNKKDRAVGEMQYVMLASNNLALFLNQSLENMQSMQSGEQQGDQSCNKPGQSKPGMDGLKKMQGELQKEMEGMQKEKGKSKKGEGKEGSRKEIAKMMARQEMIRMKLSELSEENGGNDGNARLLKELEDLMKENEKDMAEMNFDSEFFERQKEIESKMLESERADKEREQDEKRESITNEEEYDILRKKRMEEYMREKYFGIEGLDQDRLDLSPFYMNKIK